MFGGNNLDMQPTDVPQGLSVGNSDCAFLPGSVFTRPSLKEFSTLGASGQVVYAASFLKPDGTVSQLNFTRDGRMFQDGVIFGNTTSGGRFFTCNAFGKTYIANSDGFHGADVPLQLTPEGFLDRVSQDGPGGAPVATNDTITGPVTPGVTVGIHQLVVIFQTRTGYLTAPSPIGTYTATGGLRVFVEVPIGPPNVVARIVAFTGAGGGNFFYLPVAPQLNGVTYGTSTVINDNTSNGTWFNFSDESLFAGTAIDIPGNNLFNLQVLGPCMGFFSYASRLFAWGERNKVQNFRNMGFEGGSFAVSISNPTGWTVTGTGGALSQFGDYGIAWTSTSATISQSGYQDSFGIAIIQPNTQYTYRGWVRGNSIATLSSLSTGFSISATIADLNGGFRETVFSGKTPATIPSDLILTISGAATVDEIEIIYTLNPYILTAKVSYVNNPESFDGVTGIIGPEGDPHPVLGMEERKDVLCLLTAGPQGSLYETEDTPSGEPATWSVRRIASQCGLISLWGVTKFEDWFAWASDTGLRMFDGSNVEKVSQEIQPWWNGIQPQAQQFTVIANDPYTRRLYVAACQESFTFPDSMYVMDYRDLNTSASLANAGTLHVGYTGKVVTTDLTRKWSKWTMTINYMGLLLAGAGTSFMAFCGGNGGLATSTNSAVYSLNEGTIDGIDAFYGPFWQNSHYPTYFFISAEEAEQKQLGVNRLQHQFMSMNCTGVGSVFVVPNLDRIGNTGRPTRALAVSETMDRDLEFGLNLSAERISYDVRCQPAGPQPAPATSPAGFKISSLTLAVQTNPFSPIRGKNS